MVIRMFGAVLAITAVLLAVIIPTIYPVFDTGMPGPGLMPLAALAFIGVGAAGMALRHRTPARLPLRQSIWQIGGALCLLAAGAVYATAMPVIGFVPATAAFILLTCLTCGGRNPVILVLLTVLVPLLLYYGFSGLFNLPLPEASFTQE